MHLDDYKQPEEWPKLSAKLREIVKSCHKDGEMPKDVSLDMWAKLAGDYHRTRPSWSPTDSAISTPTVSDTPEPSTLPCHQTIVHRAHLVVLSPRSKSSKEKFSGRIVLDPPVCERLPLHCFPFA